MEHKEERKAANRRQRDLLAKWLRARRFFTQKAIRERILLFVSFLAIVAILQIDLVPQAVQVELGQPYHGEDIRAPRTVINTVKTEELKDQAADRVVEEAKDKPEYQTISIDAGVMAGNRFTQVFTLIDAYRVQKESGLAPNADGAGVSEAGLRELRDELAALDPRFQELSLEFYSLVVSMPAEDYDRMKRSLRQVYVTLETEEKIGSHNLETVRANLPRYINNDRFLVLAQDQPVIQSFIQAMLLPNLARDEVKIRQLQEEARKKVAPVKIEKNTLILSEGDIVTNEHIQILRDLSLIENQGNRILIFLSLTIFSLMLMGVFLLYLYYFKREMFKEERQLYLIALLVVVVLAVAKALSLTNLEWMKYLIPLSFAGIILASLSEPQLAWIITTLLSLMFGVILDFELSLTLYYFISGIAAIYSMFNLTQRKEMIQRGLILSGANFLIVLTLGFLFGAQRLGNQLIYALVAAFNGILSTALANGFMPFLEQLFKLTSTLSLLELANPNLPLLKRLLIEAPGTYHHSIIVGNLAEAAADAIGADSLLVRVGSYYHDVGKLRRPYFFIENQIPGDNPHEKLSPNLSTLIIISHVRDGVEIAKSYGVPSSIIDLIEQHHGTDLIRYFYQQASNAVQEEKETIAEADFSYPGPKPQTKEAAVVMLADSVEAATRAMRKPSSARLEAVVDQIFQERLESGQLDETNLTLGDLDKIKAAFLKVLGGIYHHRIKYPEAVPAERKKLNGDHR